MGERDSCKSLMEDLLGLLRIRIKRGVNLAIRDVNTSDPYIVVKMGKQVFFFYTTQLRHKHLTRYPKFFTLYFSETQDSYS